MDTTWLGDSWPVQGLAEALNLHALPPHIDRILLSLACFQFIYMVLAGQLAQFFMPKQWERFTDDDKANWNRRMVSLAQSLVIGPASVYCLLRQRASPNPPGLMERMWQNYDLEMQILDIAMGYFLFHFAMTVLEYEKHGMQMMLHATIGLFYIGGAYYPILNYYTVWFLVYEMTNPCLNIYHFLNQLGKPVSPVAIANAAVWIVLFFFIRVIWGTYASISICVDLFHLRDAPMTLEHLGATEFAAYRRLEAENSRPGPVRYWVFLITVLSSSILQSLNYLWFYLIVSKTLKKVSGKSKKDMKRTD